MTRTILARLAAITIIVSGCDTDRDTAQPSIVEQPETRLDAALVAHLPEGSDEETARRGLTLFPTCGVCHGMEGEGTPLGPALDDAEWIQGDGELETIAQVIRTGVPSPSEFPIPMPPLGGGNFDDADIRALATYVYALSRAGTPAAITPQ